MRQTLEENILVNAARTEAARIDKDRPAFRQQERKPFFLKDNLQCVQGQPPITRQDEPG